jgi:hypothetical protein
LLEAEIGEEIIHALWSLNLTSDTSRKFAQNFLGTNPLVTQFFKSDRPMPLRESLLIESYDQLHMDILRGWVTEQLLQMDVSTRPME